MPKLPMALYFCACMAQPCEPYGARAHGLQARPPFMPRAVSLKPQQLWQLLSWQKACQVDHVWTNGCRIRCGD